MRSGRSSDGTPLPNGAQALIRTLVDAGVTTCFTNPGTSETTELYFEICRIPGDRIIGEPGTGSKTALATLDHTRPTIGAQAVGIAQGTLDAAIAYTKERKQFGKPISDFECMMRYAKITQIYEGTNQIQRVVMARAVR